MAYANFYASQKHTINNKFKFIPEKDFWLGGKLFKAGIECEQWETRNFGWCKQVQDGKVIFCAI